MSNKETIHSLLPRAEGLLLGTISGFEIKDFNRQGAAETLTEVIAILHKVRGLLQHSGAVSINDKWLEQAITVKDEVLGTTTINPEYPITKEEDEVVILRQTDKTKTDVSGALNKLSEATDILRLINEQGIYDNYVCKKVRDFLRQ